MAANLEWSKDHESLEDIMKKILLLVLAVLFSSGARAETFADGLMSYFMNDYAVAAKILQNHAERGNLDAQVLLGTMYEKGEGVARNMREATKWWKKAADRGKAEAQYKMGNIYENGKGVSRDLREAIKWYRRAAEQENTKAQRALAYAYSKGYGVAKDNKEAAIWWGKAAQQGDPHAQCILALSYATGLGVEQNKSEAFFWAFIAAEENRKYQIVRDRMAKELTQARYNELQRRGEKWLEEFKKRKK